jgi:hypothetical protein
MNDVARRTLPVARVLFVLQCFDSDCVVCEMMKCASFVHNAARARSLCVPASKSQHVMDEITLGDVPPQTNATTATTTVAPAVEMTPREKKKRTKKPKAKGDEPPPGWRRLARVFNRSFKTNLCPHSTNILTAWCCRRWR